MTLQMKTIPGPCAQTFQCLPNAILFEAYCKVATRTDRHGVKTAPDSPVLTLRSLPKTD